MIEAVDGRIELDRVCVLGLDTCSDDASCALHEVKRLSRQNYASTIARMTLRDAANVLRAKRTVVRATNEQSGSGTVTTPNSRKECSHVELQRHNLVTTDLSEYSKRALPYAVGL